MKLDKKLEKKVTMAIVNTMGALVIRHITLCKIIEEDKGVVVYYKMKGGRKVIGVRIKANDSSVAFANGWTKPLGIDEVKRGVFMPDSFTSFSTGEFDKQVKNMGEAVFYRH